MDIRQNLLMVKNRISEAAQKSGRSAEDIKLVAVTKTHPIEVIREALKAGIKAIGENKVQEAESKIPLLSEYLPEFHFIGHLQSNKINKLMRLNPILIHSIDSYQLALNLNMYMEKVSQIQDILIEVNITGETSKSGVNPEDTRSIVENISKLPHLHIRGLMTIGLFSPDPGKTRPYFKKMKNLFDEIESSYFSDIDMDYLSMGMSDDFEIAIEEGANIVRIGSAIFGPRQYGKGA
jgi:PLP dependent protein